MPAADVQRRGSGARGCGTSTAGGRTPLAEGLLRAADVLRVERLKDAARRPLLVVVTDGRATSGPDARRPGPRGAALLIREPGRRQPS